MEPNRWIWACFFLGVSACATPPHITPPPQREIEQTRVYDKPFEQVWSRAVDWFADHNMIIDKIEKSSGLLTAKYPFEATDRGYLEYGTTSYTSGTTLVRYEGIMNVTVRAEGEMKTKVRVNVFGKYQLEYFDGIGKKPGSSGPASSTGKLEQSVLDFIGRN